MSSQSESEALPERKRQNIEDLDDDAADLFQDNKQVQPDSDSEEESEHRLKRLGKKIRKQEKPTRKKHRQRQRERSEERSRERNRERIKIKKKDRERIKDKRDRSVSSDGEKKKTKKHKRTPTVKKNTKTEQQERLDAICKIKAQAAIQKMKEAAELDIRTNKKGQASLQKIIYVKQLTKILQTTSTAEFFVNGDGLQYFEKWLRKYPDGTEPSYNLKKECFLILLRLPISGESLSRAQGLLSLVEKHQSSKERELKELADKLSFKWTNIMTYAYDDSD